MTRTLTIDERNRINPQRKAEAQRPTFYDSVTGRYTKISYDFESVTLLLPIGFRSRIGQYLTALTSGGFGPTTMTGLRTAWLDERHEDLDRVVSSYGTLVSSYDDIRAKLVEATYGFDDVTEVQRILSDLNKVAGPVIDTAENYKYARSFINVLRIKAAASPTGSNPVQTELQSLVSAMLLYP